MRKSVPRVALLPAAAGGLVAGHFLTYVLVAPSTAHRAALLRQTGHSYFPKAIGVAAALGAIAMGVCAALGYARRHAGSKALGWRPLAARMAAAQAVGFVLLEIVERTVVHSPIGGIAAVIPTGFVVEAAVAAVVAAILCLTVRSAATIASAVASRRASHARAPLAIPAPLRAERVRPTIDLLASSVSLRGPPLPSIA